MGCKPLDKKHKKGLWSPDEDEKLKTYILNYGHGCWSSVPTNAGLKRNGKSCRLRWINYLRPGLKRGAFSLEEEEIILTLHRILGNKWSNIAHHLPGRTDNEIKNHWHSYLKKRPVSKMVATDQAHPKIECMINNEQLPGFEPPPSSSKSSTPQNSSFDSFESMEASLMDTDDQSIATQNCNLPKLLFAEWLCLDQFHSHNSESNYSSAAVHSNSEDSLDHGLLFNESNTVSVDDMLPLPFQFEDQMSQSGLVDYFPGEFVINCDDMYI